MLWYGKLPKVSMYHLYQEVTHTNLNGKIKTREIYEDENIQAKKFKVVDYETIRQIMTDICNQDKLLCDIKVEKYDVDGNKRNYSLDLNLRQKLYELERQNR